MRLTFVVLLSIFLFVLTGCDASQLQALVEQLPTPVPTSADVEADGISQESSFMPQEYYELYAAPSSCPVSPLIGNERRRTFPAWWLDGSGIAAGTPIGVLFEGGNKIQWQLEEPGTPVISGERLVADSPPLETDVNMIGPYTYSSIVIFPTPGCWRLHAEAGVQTLDAIVYVYPYSCRPPGLSDRSITPSEIPCVAS